MCAAKFLLLSDAKKYQKCVYKSTFNVNIITNVTNQQNGRT